MTSQSRTPIPHQRDKEDAMQIEQVLDEYRQGDADKRLSMFLYYRELRDELDCIEQDDFSDIFAAAGTSRPVKESMPGKIRAMLRTGFWPLRSRKSGGRVMP